MIQSPAWGDFVHLAEQLKARARREAIEGNLEPIAALAVEEYLDKLMGIVEIVLTDSDVEVERAQMEHEIVASRSDLEYDDPQRLF